MKDINTNTLISKIEQINKLKKLVNVPNTKPALKKLRSELLSLVGDFPLKVGGYVLVKSYQNKDIKKPYLMIFTSDGFQKHNDYALFHNLQEIS